MSDIKLKPCPFCGSEDIYKTHSEEIPFGTKNPEIFCNTCKAIFAVEDDSPYLNCDEDFKYRREKTAEAWNKRAEPESPVVHAHWKDAVQGCHDSPHVICSACGEYFWQYFKTFRYCPNCGADMRGEQDERLG